MKRSRKERRERFNALLIEWVNRAEQYLREGNRNEDILRGLFQSFLIEKGIEKIQDKTLQERLLLESANELNKRGWG